MYSVHMLFRVANLWLLRSQTPESFGLLRNVSWVSSLVVLPGHIDIVISNNPSDTFNLSCIYCKHHYIYCWLLLSITVWPLTFYCMMRKTEVTVKCYENSFQNFKTQKNHFTVKCMPWHTILRQTWPCSTDDAKNSGSVPAIPGRRQPITNTFIV